jgi:hypothetical protein
MAACTSRARILGGLGLSLCSAVFLVVIWEAFGNIWWLTFVAFVPMYVAQYWVLPRRWSAVPVGLAFCRLLPGAGVPGFLGVAHLDDPGHRRGARARRPVHRNCVAALCRTDEVPRVRGAVRADLGGDRSSRPGQRDHRHLLVDRLPHRRPAPVRAAGQRAEHPRTEPAAACHQCHGRVGGAGADRPAVAPTGRCPGSSTGADLVTERPGRRLRGLGGLEPDDLHLGDRPDGPPLCGWSLSNPGWRTRRRAR